MLESLQIKNFRNLKDLRINSLGRVNLIAGKNNTGKSSLLEAIAIYASKGDLSVIFDLLQERGEYFKQGEMSNDIVENNLQLLSNLFPENVVSFNRSNTIVIGQSDNPLSNLDKGLDVLGIRFAYYSEELQVDENKVVTGVKRIVREAANNDTDMSNGYKPAIQIQWGAFSYIVPLDGDKLYGRSSGHWESDVFQLVGSRNIDRKENGKLWDNIVLTEIEKDVIKALRIIEPFTEGIAFVEEAPKGRVAKIKIAKTPRLLPLRSMGDGINRILTIILAMVNSENGYLLIDEFENGLHYTTQEQFWKIIFQLSEKLNVQVFATTHSEDCIEGFEYVLNDNSHSFNGKLIRLDNVKGAIKSVEYDANELKIATESDIEIR